MMSDAPHAIELDLLLQGIDKLNVGLSIIDCNLTLIASNRHFNLMLVLPAEQSQVGTPVAALYRYNAEPGEYGADDMLEPIMENVPVCNSISKSSVSLLLRLVVLQHCQRYQA
jgi:hypothetical protein